MAGRPASAPNISLATSSAPSWPYLLDLICSSFSSSATMASMPLKFPCLSKNSKVMPKSSTMARASAFMPFLASASILGPLPMRCRNMEKLVPNDAPSRPTWAPMPCTASSFSVFSSPLIPKMLAVAASYFMLSSISAGFMPKPNRARCARSAAFSKSLSSMPRASIILAMNSPPNSCGVSSTTFM